MEFTLKIDCDNAAFWGEDIDDNPVREPGPELARILNALARKVEDAAEVGSWVITDFNGNKVGKAVLANEA